MKWITIKNGCKMPTTKEAVYLFTENGQMLADYILNKNYAGVRGNNFFTPIKSGISVVRYDGSDGYTNATHWSYPPKPPRISKTKKP